MPEVNVQSYLELDPGDYEIRVGVSDPATTTVASVFADVTVPKFQSTPLSLSDIAVEIASSLSTPPAPTTSRSFRRGDHVRAVIQIYQGTQRTDPITPVSMRVQIVNAQGYRRTRSVAHVRGAGVHEPPRRRGDDASRLEPARR